MLHRFCGTDGHARNFDTRIERPPADARHRDQSVFRLGRRRAGLFGVSCRTEDWRPNATPSWPTRHPIPAAVGLHSETSDPVPAHSVESWSRLPTDRVDLKAGVDRSVAQVWDSRESAVCPCCLPPRQDNAASTNLLRIATSNPMTPISMGRTGPWKVDEFLDWLHNKLAHAMRCTDSRSGCCCQCWAERHNAFPPGGSR